MGLTDEELKAQMMAEAEAAIDRVLHEKRGADEITLSEIEELAVTAREAVGEGIAAALVEASTGETEQPPACPECGAMMRYKGQKDKWIVSEAGEVKVRRAYYHCGACGRGLFPPG